MSQESVEPNAVQEWPVGQNGRECARLKVQPCGLFHVPGYELALVQRQAAWVLEYRTLDLPEHVCSQVVALQPAEVSERLRALRAARVPAWPDGAQVLDGEYIELTLMGDNAQLTLGWWSVAPEGAEVLAEFADWMRASAGFDVDRDEAEGIA